MNSDSTLILDDHSDTLTLDGLSIALIGPDEERRKAASNVLSKCQGGVIREFSSYPPGLSDVPKLLEQHYDVIVIDLDSRPEYALELVENICALGAATVMVYSVKADSDQLVRCMRAGAREFLSLPFVESVVTEALVRAATRRPPTPPAAMKASGRLMAFLGAKGGDGVTTLACNFAVSMAKESGQSTLLIDLDLPLGDAALNLGVVAEYSTINALQNAARLDSAFLSKLLVKHSSGVSVLAAPGKFPQFDASHEAIDRLLAVARQDFDNVVIDMGSRLDLMGTSLFKDGSTVYLVIQAGIAGLRNSNRLISQYFATGIPRLEIVLNRFQSRTLGVAEEQIAKALTRPAQWKIPNDYAAVRRMQHTAVPLALEDSPISRLIRQMARTACGLPAIAEKGSGEKGSGFSFKNLGLSFTSKASSSEELSTVSTPMVEKAVEPAPVVPAEAAAESFESVEPPSAAETEAVTDAQSQPKPAEPIQFAEREAADSEEASAEEQTSEPETRIYRGATYVKGADGKWYLQKPLAGEESAVEGEPQAPVITWSAPVPIPYGVKLSSTELDATASVPGRFVYTPAEGETLAVGEHTLAAAFTPEDSKAYTVAEASVTLTVTKAVPEVKWAAPAPIFYGAVLDEPQLNATASVEGKFVYTPAAGAVLSAGEHTLSVSFTPEDGASYEPVTASVQIAVSKAVPAVNWAAPVPITYGAALDELQLNATASVSGQFVYTPAAGEVLSAGEHTLSVSFTPEDVASYETTAASVKISVAAVVPVITWSTPVPIAYGAALGSYQLNATASVPGEFAYSPAYGAVLSAGEHILLASFTPQDDANYTVVEASVLLMVTKATPIVLWPVPEAIEEGTVLGAKQLNATALVEGSFEYTPVAGDALAAGSHTLSVIFTPTAAHEYNRVQSSVQLTITENAPAMEPPAPTPVEESVELATLPLEAEPEQSTGAAEEAEATASSVSFVPETSITEAPVETEDANAVEASDEPVTELLVEPVVESEEAVAEDAFVETPIEAEAAPAVEIPAEPVVEAEEPALIPVAEEAVTAEAEASPAVEISAETTEVAAAAVPVEDSAIPAAEAKAPAVETGNAAASEQALVRIPPPKFTFEAGSGLNLMGTAVFPDGTTIYLVMQPGSGGQVDSQQLVSQFLSGGAVKPEIAINRYEPRSSGEDGEQAEEDLDQARDLPAAPRMNAAVQPASQPYAAPGKRRGFLRGLRQSLWAKVTSSEKSDGFTHLDLKQGQDAEAPTPFAATAQVRFNSGAVLSAAQFPGAESRTAVSSDRSAQVEDVRQEEANRASEPPAETRTYQGATYVKGGDGKWHLQQAPSRTVKRETAMAPEMAAVPVVSTSAASVKLPGTPVLSVPQEIEAEAAATQSEEQAAVKVAALSDAAETDHMLDVEPPPIMAEAATEPPVKKQAKDSSRRPDHGGKSASKAKPFAKTKAKASTKAVVKTKTKTSAKPASKANKTVKAPVKAAGKGVKPVKKLNKPAAKPAVKSKKAVKASAKAATKGGKAVKSTPKKIAKVAVKAKTANRTGSKAPVKATVKKSIKTPAKPAAKKKAAKAPARKPAIKR